MKVGEFKLYFYPAAGGFKKKKKKKRGEGIIGSSRDNGAPAHPCQARSAERFRQENERPLLPPTPTAMRLTSGYVSDSTSVAGNQDYDSRMFVRSCGQLVCVGDWWAEIPFSCARVLGYVLYTIYSHFERAASASETSPSLVFVKT